MRFFRFYKYLLISLLIFVLIVWMGIRLWQGEQRKGISSRPPTKTGISKNTRSKITAKITKPASSSYQPKQADSVAQGDTTTKSKNTEDNISKAEYEAIWDEIIEEIMTDAEDKPVEQTGDNEVHEEEVKKTSQLTPQKTTVIFDGIPVEVEIGKKYRVIRYGVGTWNPRPRTKEEEKRFAELLQELLFENPSKERKREIHAELNAINAETSYPPKKVSVFWLPLPGQTEEDEPPDSEIIDIDLTSGF